MKNATSLERVHIRLCVPGSILFEETPVMLNIVKEALPAWTNLTHLTLSDISTNRQKNTWSLVYILSLTLVRDAKTVKKIHRIWHGDEEISDELLELLETKSKTSPLRTLCLEHIHLDTEVDPLFWLILGAFPPKDRIQLTYCNIEWPDFRYRSTGTIFTPEFYEETEAILTVDVYTGTKMPWHDHMYSDRIFERAKGDPRVVLVKDA